MARLGAATAALATPYAVVDLPAFDRNAAVLAQRAGGKPVRVASKSVRCRALLDRALALDGFAGILAFTLPEALWLAEDHDDVVVGYPTVDRASLTRLVSDEQLLSRVTIMVDSEEQLDFVETVVGSDGPPLRVCLDLDASLRLLGGSLHLGMRRSPLHTPEQLRRMAEAVVRRRRFRLAGVMCYEGQIAGVADEAGRWARRTGVRAMQRASASELRERRAAAVAAVQQVAPLEFVNGGGTGSLERTATEDCITDIAAGSGLFGPVLFDHYSTFRPEPATYFVLDVVRRPGPRHATVLGGGWVASGPAGTDRLPTPVWPEGLRLVREEGAGEVQTPLVGDAASRLRVGDRVWFRHAKAGEVCEHVDTLHLVGGDMTVTDVSTYRGEGRTFL